MKKNLLFTFLVTGILIFQSCANVNENRQVSTSENNLKESDIQEVKSFVYNKYKLPLSVDIYKFLKSKNIEYNRQNMLDLRLQDKFFTDEKRAIALGIYSSNLLYTAINNMSQEAYNYFNASMELASKLDVADGYNSEILDKANQYIENNDSLLKFVDQAYWKTCKNLEKNNRNNILPLIVLGSWVESMHFLVKNAEGTRQEAGIYKELYNQKENLINMISYFNDLNESAETPELKNEMKNWQTRLEKILVGFNEIDVNKSTEQYNGIISQIEGLRVDLIK